MFPTWLLLLLGFLSLLAYLWLRPSARHLPPTAARPLPIFGNLLHIGGDPRARFNEWRRKCGDIYSLYLGGTLVVVLNGFDLIKEALVKRGDVFSDRPKFFADQATGIGGKGVIFSNGQHWKEQRTVTLSILRAFGMGKNVLAEKIQEEVNSYLDSLSSLPNKSGDVRLLTNMAASNIICSVLFGHRFQYEDEEFKGLMLKLSTITNDQKNVGLVNFLPWLSYLPGDLFKFKTLGVKVREVLTLLRSFMEQARGQAGSGEEAGNLIQAYILERNKKLKRGETTTLDDTNLTRIIFDLFGAGTDTTSNTLYWSVLYAVRYPHIQEKIFQEIKEHVGTDRIPTIQDRSKLPYLNAFILESQRLTSLVPHSVTHMCSEDVVLRGYNIPKGTFIVPNLDSVHHDETIWGADALSFRPERFLDENNTLITSEQLIPFGIGHRMCLGEAMAKMALFLFLSNMFQRFQFRALRSDSPPSLDYDFGIVITPKPFEVKLVDRKEI